MHANKTHHDDVQRKWKFCDKCNMFFPPNDHRHFQNRDFDCPREILCTFCNKSFKANRDHTDHCKVEHKEEISAKWYMCQRCSEYFPTEKGLNRHQKRACRKVSKGIKQEQTVDRTEANPARTRPRRAALKRMRYDQDSYDMNVDFEDRNDDWMPIVKMEEEVVDVSQNNLSSIRSYLI